MTDISFSPTLGARLRGIQQAWGHESPSESLSTILDSSINNWNIPPPQIDDIRVESGSIRVRLKERHFDYFAQVAKLSGCSTPELVRSFFIKWLCADTTQMSQKTTQVTVTCPQSPLKTIKERCKKTTKTTSKPPQIEAQAPSKPNGRALLGGLLK